MRIAPGFFGSVLLAVALAGCLGGDRPETASTDPETPLPRLLRAVHSGAGALLDPSAVPWAPMNLSGLVHSVGQEGPEPTLGVTSNGYVFFQALERTMVSTDHGRTWTRLQHPFLPTSTSDPYLWVDPTTDRVFSINMGMPFGGPGPLRRGDPVALTLGLTCAHIAWSDDHGATWTMNPIDCGPVPFIDHEKLATGPWVGSASALRQNPVYPNAVYFAYNKVFVNPTASRYYPKEVNNSGEREFGGFMAVSLDGGATFPILSKMFEPGCYSGLHGAITTGPDGTVYVPARYCPAPLIAVSRDNGLTWTSKTIGASAGVPEQQKNPDVAVDTDNNAYFVWVGSDNRSHLMVSRDHGETWSSPVLASPPLVGSVAFPMVVAGDPGRIGLAYLGTEEATEGAWAVANETRWHLYYTFSLNALDADPTFVTLRATDDADPVQRGSICISSDKCRHGNRNLLDFIDMTLDAEGRPYVAYADGCTTPQCHGPDAGWLDSRTREGHVFVLESGPSLYASKGALAPP